MPVPYWPLGADVVKIEAPGGDTLRQYPSTLEAEGRAYLGVNRSKRGIVIDIKNIDGMAVFRRLVSDADIVVHNFRPSVPARLGIDYGSLRKIKLDLIYCSLNGYGSDGPLVHKAGYDQVLQSITGICTFQGMGKGAPEIVYGSVVDFYGAALLSNAICAALFHSARTGDGQELSICLLASALAMQSTRTVWADIEGRDVDRDMRSGGVTGIHPCAGGTYLYLSANTPHFWNALCKKIGLPSLATDPNYDTVRKRAKRRDEIVAQLRSALNNRTAFEWETLFGNEVPCGAVRTLEDMFDHPQVLQQKLVAHLKHPSLGGYRTLSGPFRFGGIENPAPYAAPTKGQHTEEILRQSGFNAEDIARLESAGAVSR